MRERHELTINRLAKLAGVSASTISKIENGLLRPSLVNAINLATALGENLGFLVDRYRAAPRRTSVVRAPERPTIKPGAHSGREPMTHPGEEICSVVKGRIRFFVGEDRWELGAGDSIHFKSLRPHRWENAARGRTEVIWVFSDGLSF